MDRVLRWMEKEEIPEDTAILDIGTGNGVLLVELVGFEKKLKVWNYYAVKMPIRPTPVAYTECTKH